MHQRELPALNHEKIGGGTRLLCTTIWLQLENMFQLIVTPQGIEKVTIQLKDTPTKVYAKLILSKVPLKVLQNWLLI